MLVQDGLATDPPEVFVGVDTPDEDRLIPVAYVAGPYRDGRGSFFVEQNIRAAEAIAVELWKMGFAVICPHANTRHFDGSAPDSVWLEGDLEFVRRSDVLVTVPGWPRSVGARNEVNVARLADVPVLHWGSPAHILHLQTIGLYGRAAVKDVRRALALEN
ncbi:MAG TPA: DUF1937 family protein [bacterium]|nr:DUF1937 family protein [bacterium]